ncbi:P-loop containing nucleoside triphosphate hydrolase protein [Nemania sp. FL0031]|nr:P-loop containing nucleoside triphosphate hydrolase protein [Nemania sp. FL0031]
MDVPLQDADALPSGPPKGPESSSPESSSGASFVNLPPGDNFILNERLVKLPIYLVPRILSDWQPKYFQSRHMEMERIEAALFSKLPDSNEQDSLNHSICTITGLGGIGKTELSLKFITKFKDVIDAIFFTAADSESRLKEGYSQMALKLGLLGTLDQKDLEASSEIFRLWLANPIRGIPNSNTACATVKWLLVYDNVESTETLQKFWPRGNSGKVLITSRNPLIVPRGIFNSTTIRLEGLPTKDAVQLLQIYSSDDNNDAKSIEDATQIVEWAKGLPMAVKQLGCIIFSENTTISQFRRALNTKYQLLRRLRDTKGDEKTLATLWALESLYERHRSLFELLGVLSMLDPELVPHELLTTRSLLLSPNERLAYEASYISSRTQLAKSSLIHVSSETGDIQIHHLVQDFVRDMLFQTGQAVAFFNMAISYVASMWPFLNRNYITGTATNVDRWGTCHRLLPHIFHLRDIYEEWSNSDIVSRFTTDLPDLLLEAVQYCNERGAGHTAISLVETADNIYKSSEFTTSLATMSENRTKVYRARIGLAVSSREGDDVFKFSRQVFEIEEFLHQSKGRPSSILAVAYNDMAVGWAFRREWKRAIAFLNDSKDIREMLPGFTRDKLFSPLYHLGIVYHHQGDFDAAETTLKQAIEDRSAIFGPEDTRSVRSAALYYALGNMRLDRADRRRGDLMKALGEFKIAVAISTTCMGARNRTTLLCQYQVARASMMLQDYATARDLLGEVLTHSIDSPMYERDTARMAYYYAHCLEVQGMREESVVWLNKALGIHNGKRVGNTKTLETLAESDIIALVPYDFL